MASGGPRSLRACDALPVVGLVFTLVGWGRVVSGFLFSILWVGNVFALLALVVAAGPLVVGVALLLWTWRRQSVPDRRTLPLLIVGGMAPWVVTAAGVQMEVWVREGLLSGVVQWTVLARGLALGAVAAGILIRTGPKLNQVAPGPSGNLWGALLGERGELSGGHNA